MGGREEPTEKPDTEYWATGKSQERNDSENRWANFQRAERGH